MVTITHKGDAAGIALDLSTAWEAGRLGADNSAAALYKRAMRLVTTAKRQGA